MSISFVFDILGVIAFSMSGVLSGVHKRLDIFGIFIIAFVTAVGGGTLRDVLIHVPVFWMQNMLYVYLIFAAAIIALIFRRKLYYLKRSLFLFDTIGISLYTIIGINKGI
ncbi:MAG TPA: TRIC cation channel family protein, partial [Flavobacteriaceae bacterium]|nr:TRIC cation channel family protein [Flavobacteriaceae bacterium]